MGEGGNRGSEMPMLQDGVFFFTAHTLCASLDGPKYPGFIRMVPN